MRAISLFSGVGGFEIGFERAGINTVLQAERDPWALQVLARHWPQTKRVTDVREIRIQPGTVSDIAGGMGRILEGGYDPRRDHGARATEGEAASGIDLVYGGFPCQDLSVAGKRAGLGGERSGLWFEFHRVLSELRPRWAVIENVPGLLSSNQGRDFAILLAGLDELGFDVAWAVLDAQNFGVPQRRRRVFIVAGPTGRAVEQVLSLCEGCGGNPETGGTAGEGLAVASLIGANESGGYRDDLDNSTYVVGSLAPIPIQDAREVEKQQNGIGDAGDPMFTIDAAPRHGVMTETITANWSKGAGNTQAEMGIVQPTAAGVRRLTPLECERLMGWPDDHTRWTADGREIADTPRYRMCGNGVVAPVAEWIGHRLVAVDAM